MSTECPKPSHRLTKMTYQSFGSVYKTKDPRAGLFCLCQLADYCASLGKLETTKKHRSEHLHMKTNPTLYRTIGLSNAQQEAWYAAHILMSALTDSPAIVIAPAIPAIIAKPAILAQTAKPARAESQAVLAANNTTGYAFGELYLNSPAYPAGTAIPRIPAKRASAEVIGVPEVIGVAGKPQIATPVIKAVPGWSDAIQISQSDTNLIVTAELPAYSGVGLVGSDKLVIGEITPPGLQASAFVDTPAGGISNGTANTLTATTVEELFYKAALQIPGTIVTDVVRTAPGMAVNCKRIVVTIPTPEGFDIQSDSLQLDKLKTPSINLAFANDAAWIAYAPTHQSLFPNHYRAAERFVTFVDDTWRNGYGNCAFTNATRDIKIAGFVADRRNYTMTVCEYYDYPSGTNWTYYDFVDLNTNY
jgi:hypothetical protein